MTGGAPIGDAGRGPWRGGLRWAAGALGVVVLGYATLFVLADAHVIAPPQAPVVTTPTHAIYEPPAGTAPTNAPPYPASGTAPAYHAPQPVASVAPGPTAAEVACYTRFGGEAVMARRGVWVCNHNPSTRTLNIVNARTGAVTIIQEAGAPGIALITCVPAGQDGIALPVPQGHVPPMCNPWPNAWMPSGDYVNLKTRVEIPAPAAASCPPTLTGRRSSGLTNRGAMLLTLYLVNPQTGARVPLSGWIDTGAMETVVAHGEGPAVGLQPHAFSMGLQGVDGAPTASHTYTADLQTAAGYTVSRGAMDVSSAALPAAGWGLSPTTLLLGQSFLRNWTLVEAATTWSLSPNWCTPTTTENVG